MTSLRVAKSTTSSEPALQLDSFEFLVESVSSLTDFIEDLFVDAHFTKRAVWRLSDISLCLMCDGSECILCFRDFLSCCDWLVLSRRSLSCIVCFIGTLFGSVSISAFLCDLEIVRKSNKFSTNTH